MRLRDQVARWGSALVLVAGVLSPSSARAEVDNFHTGDGHSGPKTATALRTIVNSYAPLAANAGVGDSQLTIGSITGDPAGFAANDLVAIWTATGGNPSATGVYELARVQTVAGSTLTLTKPITVFPPDVPAFPAGITQVVRVPEFTTVNVPSGTSIAAVPWTGDAVAGFSGGILIILATGTVTVNGALDADKAGFRGGALDDAVETSTSCPSGDGLPANGYAPKGEGTSTAVPGTPVGGRAYATNAGGGGNCVQNGGGGGGHAGVGGRGGDAILGQDLGGQGGWLPLPIYSWFTFDQAKQDPIQRIMFGGGGGSGEQRNGVGSAGGAGGGAIIVRAGSLAGAGRISADGESAASAGLDALNQSDGAGGGGAGGGILIRLVGHASCAEVSARGGNGGDTSVGTSSAWGPGGGGSGGRVAWQSAPGGACPIHLDQGAPGHIGGDSRGAFNGTFGDLVPTSDQGAYCVPLTNDPACTGTTPFCSVDSTCRGCTATFGQTFRLAPSTIFPCGTADAPFCQKDGSCTCEPDASTPCGASCASDADCASDQWCAGHCIAKVPNGQPVPNIPPLRGACTPENGARACLSGTCDVSDSLCGAKSNQTCCGDAQCRSNVCDPGDHLCGLLMAQPCATDADCRSNHCSLLCVHCALDSDCGVGHLCDVPHDRCIAGCRERNGVSNCPKGLSCDAHDGTAGTCVNAPGPSVFEPPCPIPPPPDAGAPPTPDAGLPASPVGGAAAADAGDEISGGGCACGAVAGGPRQPFAIAGLAGLVGALLLRRNRRRARP